MAETSVVYFAHTDVGAPSLTNANGSLIGVLDACLINGYGLKTITSLTVAGGVATATCAGHGFTNDSVNEVMGATPAALNGRQRLAVVDANSFTFQTAAANGAATGTITIKRAPLGWAKQFSSGATKAVYQRTDPAATAMVLRVEDTGAGIATATGARATMYEAMTGVDSGTGATADLWWGKGSNTAAAKTWYLVGDSKGFYLFTDPAGSYATWGTLSTFVFGDILPYRPGDAYCAYLQGGDADGTCTCPGGLPAQAFAGQITAASVAHVFSRSWTGLGGAVSTSAIGLGGPNPGVGSCAYPSPVDNGAVIIPRVLAAEISSTYQSPIRGEFRGVATPAGAIAAALAFKVIPNLIGSTRSYLVMPGSSNYTSKMCSVIDITGPWG